MDVEVGVTIEISDEHRTACRDLFDQFDELTNPDRLRAFVMVTELRLVRQCVPKSCQLEYDEFIAKLMTTRRSPLEPALFDLLDVLASRYKEEERAKTCNQLKEKIRGTLLRAEKHAKDYQQLAEDSAADSKRGAARSAKAWVDEAGDDPDELALRITLAVFHGTPFETIEAAKNDLLKMLQELMPPAPPAPDAPPPPRVPLMRRLHKAGAFETEGEPPDWEGVVKLKAPVASEVILHVWQFYREAEWRLGLMAWLTLYAVGHPAEVRTRAAVAVGIIATKDYRLVCDTLLGNWARAESNESQYRAAIGMALGVLALKKDRIEDVQSLLRDWSKSPHQAERWAALRAYIYVGAYCLPVKEVIESWREIAAFAVNTRESVAIVVEDDKLKVVKLKAMLMSLMEAMRRFFVFVAQMPAEEKRPRFAGILEGLKEWIADDKADAELGRFMFTTLGQLVVSAGEDAEAYGAPALLQLLPEGPDESGYRSQLAALFEVLMRNGATITDAKELLCAWLGWADALEADSQLYESRIRALFEEIVAADKSGRVRGKLAACLRACGRNNVARRILSGLEAPTATK